MATWLSVNGDLFGGLGVIIRSVPREAVPGVPTDPADSPGSAHPLDRHERLADSSFELLIRAKEGDGSALDQLCALYLPRLRRWAHGRLPASSRNLLDTEDLVQDVLIKAAKRIDLFEPRHEGAFQGYLREMLLNRLRDEGRKGRRRPAESDLEDEHFAEGPSPLEMTIGREALEQYEAALARLRPQERELIVAKLELGFSAAELAKQFGKPTPAAAQTAVSRALVKLAEEMSRGR